MLQYLWILWLAAIIAFSALELSTVNMVSVWFVGGSLSALIANLLGAQVWLQITLFFVVSAVLLASLRPFVKKYVAPKKTATNVDTVFGREVRVIETIDNLRETGAVRLDGKVWTARSLCDTVVPEGTLVKIVKLEGVKLYVEPAEVAVGS